MCSTWVIWLRWSEHYMPPAGGMGGGMQDEDSFPNYHITRISALKFPGICAPYLRTACPPVFFNPWTNNWYGECLQHAYPITLPAISRKRLSDTSAPGPWILRHCHALSRPGLGSFAISLGKFFGKEARNRGSTNTEMRKSLCKTYLSRTQARPGRAGKQQQ